MKCPKCGFNSFEYLDSCKKCAAPLQDFKQGLGIKPLLFAPSTDGQFADTATPADLGGIAEGGDDFMFETAATAAPATEEGGFDGFDFDFNKEATTVAEDDAFDFNMDVAENDAGGAFPVEGNDLTQPAAQDEEEGFSLDAFTQEGSDEFSFDDVLPASEEEKENKKEPAPAEELDDWSSLFAEDKDSK